MKRKQAQIYRKEAGKGKTAQGIFNSIIVMGIVTFMYLNFPESPLIAGAFIGGLIFFYSMLVPILLEVLKKDVSKVISFTLVLGITLVTYFSVSMFL